MTVKDVKDLLACSEKSFPELEALIKDKNDNTQLNIIDRNDYIATKLWLMEDVEKEINDMIEDIPEEIQSITPLLTKRQEILDNCRSEEFDALSDCTDSEWDYIRSVITNNALAVLHTPHTISGCVLDITNKEQPKCICQECKAYPVTRKIIMYGLHKPWGPNRKYVFCDNNGQKYPLYPVKLIPEHPKKNAYWTYD